MRLYKYILGGAFFSVLSSVNAEEITGQDYTDALQSSWLFYEAQKSGELPESNRLNWRGDSALNDGKYLGDNTDLTGGWYDAGDHIKVNYTIAYSTTMLAWGIDEFRDAYKKNPATYIKALENVKYATDYLQKTIVADDNGDISKIYIGVGSPHVDHEFWGPAEAVGIAEDSEPSRQVVVIERSCGGVEVAAEMSAAFSAASLAFGEAGGEYGTEADELRKLAEKLELYASSSHKSVLLCAKDAKDNELVYQQPGDYVKDKSLPPYGNIRTDWSGVYEPIDFHVNDDDTYRDSDRYLDAYIQDPETEWTFNKYLSIDSMDDLIWARAWLAKTYWGYVPSKHNHYKDSAKELLDEYHKRRDVYTTAEKSYTSHLADWAILDWSEKIYGSYLLMSHIYWADEFKQPGGISKHWEGLDRIMWFSIAGAPFYSSPNVPITDDNKNEKFGDLDIPGWFFGEKLQAVYTSGGLMLPKYLKGVDNSGGMENQDPQWGGLRYTASSSFLALAYAKMLKDAEDSTPYKTKIATLLQFAKDQTDYILGDNPNNYSYLVRKGKTDVNGTLHHRTAHGSWNGDDASPAENRHTLYGALAGGPGFQDEYPLDRNAYEHTEVAIDYNAAMTSALAGIVHFENFSSFREKFFDEGKRGSEVGLSAQKISTGSGYAPKIKFTIENRTAWPAKALTGGAVEYFMDFSDDYNAGRRIEDLEFIYEDLDSAEIIIDSESVSYYQSSENNNIYLSVVIEFSIPEKNVWIPGEKAPSDDGSVRTKNHVVSFTMDIRDRVHGKRTHDNDPSLEGLSFGQLSSPTKVYAYGLDTFHNQYSFESRPILGADDLDSDLDGLSDIDEVDVYGTNPMSPDKDEDNLTDAQEISFGSDPNLKDSDGDGLHDGDEFAYGTLPNKKDSDDDGLSDGDEIHVYGSNPKNPDSDGDQIPDGDDPEPTVMDAGFFYASRILPPVSLLLH